jgi:aryl-alcohol dehydrogenase-like predicted oxidoreductase
VDETVARAALRRTRELGVTFFDTSNLYGCGRSEFLLGEVIGNDLGVVVATKFGFVVEGGSTEYRQDVSAEAIRAQCEASLRRLRRDRIDLYLLHVDPLPAAQVSDVVATLEDLVVEGAIGWYGWSTDDARVAQAMVPGPHCGAFEFNCNPLEDNAAMRALCARAGVGAIARQPLSMGLLTGKFRGLADVPDDIRRAVWLHDHFGPFDLDAALGKVDALRPVLAREDRTMAQGAIAWAIARDTLPIPGFKNVQQVDENYAPAAHIALSVAELARVDAALASVIGRTEGPPGRS